MVSWNSFPLSPAHQPQSSNAGLASQPFMTCDVCYQDSLSAPAGGHLFVVRIPGAAPICVERVRFDCPPTLVVLRTYGSDRQTLWLRKGLKVTQTTRNGFLFCTSSSHLRTALRVAVGAHISQDHTPGLGPRVTPLEGLIIIPHELAIRFCHNPSLRIRIHHRSAVEVEPWVGNRLGDVRFVRNEELNQQ